MPVEVKLILGGITESLVQKPEITGENPEKLGVKIEVIADGRTVY